MKFNYRGTKHFQASLLAGARNSFLLNMHILNRYLALIHLTKKQWAMLCYIYLITEKLIKFRDLNIFLKIYDIRINYSENHNNITII